MRRLIAILGSVVILAACAPKVNLSPAFSGNTPRSVALVTVEAKGVNRPETIDYLFSALRSELSSRGYLVLDPRIVESVCKTPGCSKEERAELGRRGASAFVQLQVDAQSESNFGLGYYNTVAGKLLITDSHAVELASVAHQESERGGLIFNSGQVLQGLQDSVDNLEAKNRNYLADEFVRTLVAQLPKPASQVTATEAQPTITAVDVTSVRPPVTEICGSAPAGLNASLLVDGRRTPLREVSPGTYCGNFVFVGGLTVPSRVQLEVRTQFGSAARRDVSLPTLASCDLQTRVRIVNVGGSRRIEVQCGKPVAETCSNPLGECGITELAVYRATKPTGPFISLGQTTKAVWTDTKAPPKGSEVFYQVVAINSNGTRSLPVSPQGE